MKILIPKKGSCLSIILCSMAWVLFMSSVAFAQPLKDPFSYPFYDPESGGTSCANTAAGSGIKGPAFMIGDSITVGATKEIESTLQQSGISVTIDALSNRRLSSGSSPLDGLTVLQNSSAAMQDVEAVIVALGTNSGLTAANIQAAITTIKQATQDNPEAKIYWVNIGIDNTKREDPLPFEGWNETLQEFQESNKDLDGIINWAEVIAKNPDYITSDGVGAHLTPEGREAFASAIARGLSGQQSTGTGSCQLLPGNDNAERVWNFFIAKGWQPWIIAGILGNMQAESGIQHLRYQGTPDGTETSSSDVINGTVSGGPAWGIVQWDPPSKIIQSALDAGISYEEIDTLEFQLEFLFGQLTGTGLGGQATPGEKSRAGDPLLATTTVEQAALSFAQDFERCANCGSLSHIQPRIDFAIDILNRFGSGTP